MKEAQNLKKLTILSFILTLLFFILIIYIARLKEPAFRAVTGKEFINNVNNCVDYLERSYLKKDQKINRQLIVTKASLESNYGRSRFAKEGNNLFGIRQFSNLEKGMLPDGQPDTINWRVAKFKTKCDSIRYYINLLNNNHHYEDFRKEREYQKLNNLNIPTRYFVKLEKYATNPNYSNLLLRTYLEIYEPK
jgi:uncharacterized FlgJ-related protein